MSWDVRPCSSKDELRAAVSPIWHYFGRSGPSPDDQIERVTSVLAAERMHAAWEDGRAVGGAGAFAFELTVPGGRVPAAGVTAVAVLPTHRRRGILRAMMRAQLDACRERGEPIAYLWATEDTIYGRFGYGIASFTAEIELPRERSAYHAPFEPSGAARLMPLREAEDVLTPVYERVAVETPGMFTRTAAWWQARALADPEWRRRGGGDLQCVVLELDGGPAAYALYRLNVAFERGLQTGTVEVVEAMGDSPRATRAIWRYLLDIDWMARVRASLLPVDHPLLLLLAEPRRLRFNVRDGLWVRLVDVGAALAVRSFTAQGSVVVEVADRFCPWNEGGWRVSDGGVARTDDEPELRCDVTALGSVYLGGFTWTQLARALRVDEVRRGAIARADALFHTGPAPWCPEIF
ncbi:MAG: GNAT family N-acetyltransferase [Candidatus Rokuibacteriota bacterium]|nr:MAG: GNAT family N-acetyltransferase [Candidatus Rokubacteria bacterium]